MRDPREAIRPRALWYWAGAGVMVLGLAAAVAVFLVAFRGPFEEIRELDRRIDALQRFSVPGDGLVRLGETGEFVIYGEGPGTSADFGTFDPASVTVEPTAGEPTELEVRPVVLDETYDFGGPAGRSSVEFTVEDPGDYRITIDAAPSGVTTAAVGRRLDLVGTFASIAVAILVPVGVGLVFLTLGAVIMIVTGVRRSSWRRRRREAAAASAGAFGAPGSGGWPPPGTPGAPGGAGAATPGSWAPPPSWPPPASPSAPSWPPPPPPAAPPPQ